MPTKRSKRATSAKTTARRKLGLTKGTAKDLPAVDRRTDSVKGGAVKRVWTAGNNQPQ
jgi:hypothetical protein